MCRIYRYLSEVVKYVFTSLFANLAIAAVCRHVCKEMTC